MNVVIITYYISEVKATLSHFYHLGHYRVALLNPDINY